MTRYFSFGYYKFKLERTSSGYYDLTTKYNHGSNKRPDWETFRDRFSTMEQAYAEMMSFAQCDGEDFDEEV